MRSELKCCGAQEPHCYHPETKFAQVMFLHLSVSHSVHKGVSTWAGTHLGKYTPTPLGRSPLAGIPQGGTPWADTLREQCMLGDTGNKWAVRILLECILVPIFYCHSYVITGACPSVSLSTGDFQNDHPHDALEHGTYNTAPIYYTSNIAQTEKQNRCLPMFTRKGSSLAGQHKNKQGLLNQFLLL